MRPSGNFCKSGAAVARVFPPPVPATRKIFSFLVTKQRTYLMPRMRTELVVWSAHIRVEKLRQRLKHSVKSIGRFVGGQD